MFKKGVRAAEVGDLNPGEGEVILPPGKKCRVVKREKKAEGGEYVELEDDGSDSEGKDAE